MKPHTVCMLAVFLFVLMVNSAKAESRCWIGYAFAHMKIDEVYVNGRENTVNPNGVTTIHNICRPPGEVGPPGQRGVIAIKASCPNVPYNCSRGGLKASVEYLGILTNQDSWKCTEQLYGNWMLTGYDDSGWPSAVEYNYYPAGPKPINPDAKWIWTHRNGQMPSKSRAIPPEDIAVPHYFPLDSPVYCRVKYRSPGASPVTD